MRPVAVARESHGRQAPVDGIRPILERVLLARLRALATWLWLAVPEGRSLPEDVWRRRHDGIVVLLWLHVAGIGVFAFIAGFDLVHALGESTVVAVAAVIASFRRGSRKFRASVASCGLVMASAVLVHLSGGYIELHFHFFVMVAIISLYQDWAPLLTAIVFVIVHHGGAGILDPRSVYNHEAAWAAPWLWAGIHGTFVLAMVLATLVAWRLNEVTHGRVELLLDSVAEGIFGVDLAGRVTFVNAAALRMMGWDATAMVGVPVGINLQPAVVPDEGAPDRQVGEALWQRRNGTTFPVEYTSAPILERNQRQGTVFVFRDLTRRKELEQQVALERQVAQTQKLEAIGQLAAGVAHEINTPLQFIGDNLQFVRNGLGDLLAPSDSGRAGDSVAPDGVDVEFLLAEVPRAVAEALEGVERVTTIVRALKEFAHPDPTEAAAVDLNQALRNTLTIARNEIKYVAEVDLDLAAIPTVLSHPGDINQVLLNIIVNAVHAIADVVTGTGGMGRIRITSRQEGGEVVVAISDTGGGIPEAIQSRIFDPFFTTKEIGRGTGQGLAIARTIVTNKLGGSLSFETEVGRGTTFFIRLPILGAAR